MEYRTESAQGASVGLVKPRLPGRARLEDAFKGSQCIQPDSFLLGTGNERTLESEGSLWYGGHTSSVLTGPSPPNWVPAVLLFHSQFSDP